MISLLIQFSKQNSLINGCAKGVFIAKGDTLAEVFDLNML